MIKSMTGYGKGEAVLPHKRITVEIRSLNGKQLDMSVRLPSLYRQFEYEIRNRISKAVGRGKVDVYISVENTSPVVEGVINRELFKAYANELKSISAELGATKDSTPEIIQSVLRLPNVVSMDIAKVSDEEQTMLFSAVDGAIKHIDEFRQQEGAVLIADLLARVDKIEVLKESVIPFEKERVETIKIRLQDAISQLKVEVDSNRLEQEMIFYFEKLDVTEEKVRLSNHCKYFREVSQEEEGVGRKLGFIAQEMGREINTLGSKANHSQIQHIVVQMKDELEKVKEQALNIL